MKTKQFLSAFLLFASLQSWADGGYKSAVILMNDETKVGVNLTSDLSFGFAAEQLAVTSSTVNLSFSLDEVKQWAYSEETIQTSGIKDVATVESVNRVGDQLIITNMPQASKVEVYDVNGQRLAAYSADGQLTVSLDRYSHGIYLININGKTLKISK